MSGTLPPVDAIQKLLASMPQLEASDLHLKVGYAPFFRVAGQLRKVDMPPIADSAYIEEMFASLIVLDAVEPGSAIFQAFCAPILHCDSLECARHWRMWREFSELDLQSCLD